MKVIVNKENLDIPEDFKLIDLLNYLDYGRNVAVFIDKEQILLSEYDSRQIKENNTINILRPLAGG